MGDMTPRTYCPNVLRKFHKIFHTPMRGCNKKYTLRIQNNGAKFWRERPNIISLLIYLDLEEYVEVINQGEIIKK